MLIKGDKSKIIKDNKSHLSDTGSPEVQIALLTERLSYQTKHLETHKKDHSSRTGLMKLVGQRKRLLEYLKRENVKKYENLIKKLKLRK